MTCDGENISPAPLSQKGYRRVTSGQSSCAQDVNN